MFKYQSLFEKTFKFYAAEDGSAPGAAVVSPSPASEVAAPVQAPAPAAPMLWGDAAAAGEASPAAPTAPQYLGNKDLNPEQKPLSFDTKGLSQDEIDQMIRLNPTEEMFLKETQADLQPGVPVVEDNPADVKPVEPEDPSVKAFLDNIGLDQAQFSKLPEAAQEKLATLQEVITQAETKVAEYEKVLTQQTESLKQLQENDPVIAARLRELNTGENLVAKDLPPISDQDLVEIEDIAVNGTKEELLAKLSALDKTRSSAVIAKERTEYDRIQADKKISEKFVGVISDIFSSDTRMKTEEKDLLKITEGHKDWSKVEDFKKYIISKGWTMEDVINQGAKETFAAYKAHKGWDQEDFKKAYAAGGKKLLENIRKSTNAARTLDAGKAPQSPVSELSQTGAIDRESLMQDLIKGNGNSASYDRLLEIHGSNLTVLNQLTEIHAEATQRMLRKQ